MFLFAHTGITLGSAFVVQGVALHCRPHEPAASSQLKRAETASKNKAKFFSLSAVATALTANIDIRWLLIGALLPDIIDKPLSLLHFGSGRSIAHTLLFLLVFAVSGLILFAWRKWKTALVLSAGIFTHLILDSMWKEPNILFWPFRGAHFSTSNPSEWISVWEKLITQNPAVYTGEIIGFAIVISFGWWLWKQKQITAFVKNGYLHQ